MENPHVAHESSAINICRSICETRAVLNYSVDVHLNYGVCKFKSMQFFSTTLIVANYLPMKRSEFTTNLDNYGLCNMDLCKIKGTGSAIYSTVDMVLQFHIRCQLQFQNIPYKTACHMCVKQLIADT